MKKIMLAILFGTLVPSQPVFAQDEAIPKPRAKTAPAKSQPSKATAPAVVVGGTTLLLTTDVDCELRLDGVSQGTLKADDEKVVHTSAGDHLLRATSLNGQYKWQDTVTAVAATQKVVKIALGAQVRQQKEAEEAAKLVWTDSSTNLTWAKRDNDSDVTWQQARDYCRNLQLAGHGDWRLATIDELQQIYDLAGKVNEYHVKGNLQLSGWPWSSSTGNASGEAWFFHFGNGERYSYLLGNSIGLRALCVRRSGA